MNEIRCLGGSSWVGEAAATIGFFEKDGLVTVIDSGLDKESGRKIRKAADEKGWKITAVINTHSHADHTGGNAYLQEQTNCAIWAPSVEASFVENPKLEAAFLWGGFALKELKSRFFEAKPSRVTNLIPSDGKISETLTAISLGGHSFNHMGILTCDRVCFLGDSLLGENVLQKHAVPFLYDVAAYRQTLKTVPLINADIFVLSHGGIETVAGITSLASRNLEVICAIEAAVLRSATSDGGKIFEDILAHVCDLFGFELTLAQYALTGSTIRSFISYLHTEGKLNYEISGNKFYWKAV